MSRSEKRRRRQRDHIVWLQWQGRACVVCGAHVDIRDGEYQSRDDGQLPSEVFVCEDHIDDDRVVNQAWDDLRVDS